MQEAIEEVSTLFAAAQEKESPTKKKKKDKKRKNEALQNGNMNGTLDNGYATEEKMNVDEKPEEEAPKKKKKKKKSQSREKDEWALLRGVFFFCELKRSLG